MRLDKITLDAIYDLTLVQRPVLYRPLPNRTMNVFETQVIWRTNDLIHCITNPNPPSGVIESATNNWHEEMLKVAARFP